MFTYHALLTFSVSETRLNQNIVILKEGNSVSETKAKQIKYCDIDGWHFHLEIYVENENLYNIFTGK
jgi:hypothetical protein